MIHSSLYMQRRAVAASGAKQSAVESVDGTQNHC
jgi:hypothetical protein